MPRANFTFINHACFMMRTDGALLVSDPWLDGAVLDGAWDLVDSSTSSAGMIEELGAAGVPVYIWCSRAQPDRFSLPFLKRFRAEFRGIATFLYRPGRDMRIGDELRRHRLPVAECPDGVTVRLAGDLRLTAIANGDGDTACLVGCAGRNILNLGDRALATAASCQAIAPRIAQLAPRIDLLLTGFGSMGWCGNPEGYAEREAAAAAAVERLAVQVERFRPKLVVPVASFARFARADNAWLNGGRLSPAELLETPRLDGVRGVLRFLVPGTSIDLQRDTPVSLAPAHHLALAHWADCWRKRPAPLPGPPQASLGELKAAFTRYCERVTAATHLLPRVLETVGLLKPLRVHLPDLRQNVELSYRHGLRMLPRVQGAGSGPNSGQSGGAHVAMFSGTALQLLRLEDGFDTVYAGGCFWTLRRGGLSAFGRFFLPQRMGRRGADRHRPLAMGSFLLRALVGRMARQLQAVLH
ncbi:hypothetical protein [Telluria aromaticivorans]|uniref:MBL fold metallo-hydrolase n=1 Tax=Telluria aromaticivorans TaxID=2725995 RepID=A0A7Y2K308_9BURK|nr:hypothetical protein [Telluria aromaticivorans]NNG25388.1 hypothetical protein [Telluria aromaticivorans]